MVIFAEGDGSDQVNSPRESVLRPQRYQVKLLFERGFLAVSFSPFLALIIAIAVWDKVPVAWLGAWLLGLGLVLAGRFQIIRCYRQATASSLVDPDQFGRRYIVTVVLSGVLWGTAGGLFVIPGSPDSELIVGLVLAGASAWALAAFGSYPVGYFLFLFPALTPFAGRALLQGGGVQEAVALTTLIFALLMLAVSQGLGRAFRDALRLQADNTRLQFELNAVSDRHDAVSGILQQQISEKLKAERSFQESRLLQDKSLRDRVAEFDRALERAHRERDLLRAMLAGQRDAVIATDADDRVSFINRAGEGLTGWAGHDALGKPLARVLRVSPAGRGSATESDASLSWLSTGNHRCAVHGFGRRPSPITVSSVPIRLVDGVEAGRVLTCRLAADCSEVLAPDQSPEVPAVGLPK
jgi:PAS domain-containing protein